MFYFQTREYVDKQSYGRAIRRQVNREENLGYVHEMQNNNPPRLSIMLQVSSHSGLG